MSRILLVDNEPGILSVLSSLLKAEGYEVVTAREAEKAHELIKAEPFDLLISDIRMSPVGGMQLLKWARTERPEMSVIMLTAYGSVETAIEAMKLGAFDYVTKPFKVDELLITIQRALEYKRAMTENVDLKSQLATKYRFENIIAESESMKKVCDMIQRVAPTDTTVLITGESGTGKELVARAIHNASRRKQKKFLAVNCAALPEPLLESEMFGHVKGAFTGATSDKAGLFEAVEGGTLFLDEIGSMPLNIQGKLLRAIQEREIRRVGSNQNIPVDARILAATNTSLEEKVAQESFREDLFYRLNVISIYIEPLRKRKEDIAPLVYHIIRQETDPQAPMPIVDKEAMDILENYNWPGNVRELENAVKHALTFVRDNKITVSVLPKKIISAVTDMRMSNQTEIKLDGGRFKSLKAFLRNKEREYLEQVIASVGGDKEKAASILKISLATLYRKLSELEDTGENESTVS